MKIKIDCEHTAVIVIPKQVTRHEGGFEIKDYTTDSTMICKLCNQELPLEDLQFYSKSNISIGIPDNNNHSLL